MPLWAALYTAHAILVLAGVPLLANLWPMWNVCLPLSGYGFVAMLLSHLYSRYALRKLRNLAGPPEDTPEGGG